MRFWEVDWVLKEADKFPGGNHLFWKISKGTLLILGGKKPLPHPNSWRRKVVMSGSDIPRGGVQKLDGTVKR